MNRTARTPSNAERPDPPVVPRDLDALTALHELCARVGYTNENINELLSRDDGAAPEPKAVQVRRLHGSSPLGTMTRLFRLGLTVDTSTATSALGSHTLDSMMVGGLLELDDGGVRARFALGELDGVLVLSDRRATADLSDFVTGVSPSAQMMAWVTVRRHVDAALDLGTGPGLQALLAARHCNAITGVDINARALGFARANAALNETEAAEWAEGSWLEPVAERRFDLVIANPPYVISPDAEFLYRDGGLPGDQLCRRLIEEIPLHLERRGIAQVQCDWIESTEGDWVESVRTWATDSGCDALIIRFATLYPLSYAAAWNEPLRTTDAAAYERALDRWLAYYDEHSIRRIGSGLVCLRRRESGAVRVHAVEAHHRPSGTCGDHVLRLLDAIDHRDRVRDDEALLGERLCLVNGHRIRQTLRFEAGRYRSHPAEISTGRGLGVTATVDPDALDALFRCDGSHRLGDLLDESLRETVLPAARDLLAKGFLVPRQALVTPG